MLKPGESGGVKGAAASPPPPPPPPDAAAGGCCGARVASEAVDVDGTAWTDAGPSERGSTVVSAVAEGATCKGVETTGGAGASRRGGRRGKGGPGSDGDSSCRCCWISDEATRSGKDGGAAELAAPKPCDCLRAVKASTRSVPSDAGGTGSGRRRGGSGGEEGVGAPDGVTEADRACVWTMGTAGGSALAFDPDDVGGGGTELARA